MIELIDSFQNEGSGWIFEEVLYFDIFFNDYKPLQGSSYIPLPKYLASKKAIINPKNEDQECFKLSVSNRSCLSTEGSSREDNESVAKEF